jgi:hypothetical protein
LLFGRLRRTGRAGTAGRAGTSRNDRRVTPRSPCRSSYSSLPALPALASRLLRGCLPIADLKGRPARHCTPIQLKLPVRPLAPFVSSTRRITCRAGGERDAGFRKRPPGLPVSRVGHVNSPVRSRTFTSMWNLPPVPDDETRACNV